MPLCVPRWAWLLGTFIFLAFSRAAAQFSVGVTLQDVISFQNTNGYIWDNTVIVDTIPAQLTYVSCSGAPCSDDDGAVVWDFGTVASGQSAAVTYLAYINTCSDYAVTDQGAIYVVSPPATFTTNTTSFTVDCSTFTPTPTATSTPTPTITSTVTATPTITFTPTITPTPTPTCPIHLWPDPFNPQYAFDGQLRVDCLQSGDRILVFTVSGELVDQVGESNGLAFWMGLNEKGKPVAPGVYLYVVENSAGRTRAVGKFLLVR